MLTSTSLSGIVALARAGALEHAWYEFAAAGYDRADEDPAALTVKGRLLKDKAVRARGEERRRFYLESAEAYRRAADLQPGTYPLINAATLSLLSGNRDQAEDIALEVLERIEREPEEPETPYWRAATEAEALLLLGRFDEAQPRLEAAVAAAPRAWEDHASTLRQFILIHDALGADAGWLELLRPPRSLAFGGDRAVSDAAGSSAVTAAVAEFAAGERIGFAFGSLAAGSDIAAAEALLGLGAELHVVLPSDPESVARVCIDPFGADWRQRFDAALEAADTVHLLRPLQTAPDSAAIALADTVALGAARLNAERLMSEARELAVAPPPDAQPFGTADAAEARAPIALLSVSVGGAAEHEFEERLAAVRELLDDAAPLAIAPHLRGDEIVIGFSDAGAGADAALRIHDRLRGRMPLRIAGHFGFTPAVRDPFLASLRPTESGAAIVAAIARATPPDTVCISLDFAAALAAAGRSACASWIGELQAFDGGTPIPLYALRSSRSDD